MRERAEKHAWQMLERARSRTILLPQSYALNQSNWITIDRRCQLLAGLNGAGKTEALQKIADEAGGSGCLVRVHEIVEHVRSTLRSRTDIEDMEEEVGAMSIEPDLVASLGRVIGREYETVEWFGLELEPTQPGFTGWPWPSSEELLVPHFRVTHSGISYSSTEMGLGEFSAHIVFWVLWQYRDRAGTVFLLDEPDAYLPPRTRMRFLALVLEMARKYDWQLVISSHSEEMIAAAHERESLTVLLREAGLVRAYKSSDFGSQLIRELVTQAPVDLILFCEDESAAAFTRAILAAHAEEIFDKAAVIWKDGDGYLRKLAEHLPRAPASPVKFSLVFDGDQRVRLQENPAADGGWPWMCLPTDESPDGLFKSLGSKLDQLVEHLGSDPVALRMTMAAIEGFEEHDWVNALCSRFPNRTKVLDALARTWVELNPQQSQAFCEELKESLWS